MTAITTAWVILGLPAEIQERETTVTYVATHVPLLTFVDDSWVPWAIWLMGPLVMIGTLVIYVLFFRERLTVYYPRVHPAGARVPLLGLVDPDGRIRTFESAVLGPVIVLSPNRGDTVHTPFHIHGLADTYRRSVVVELLDQDTGTWDVIEVVSAEGPLNEHSPFVAEVDVAPGHRLLRVGMHSPRDGEFRGIELPLTIVET